MQTRSKTDPRTASSSGGSKETATSTTTTMTTTRRILVIGLAGTPPGAPPSEKIPTGTLRQKIQSQVKEAKDLGFELEVMQVKASEFDTKLKHIKTKLNHEPGYDGLMIGNGIRGCAAYTVFFEDLVNSCRKTSPRTHLLFNTSPMDIIDTCRRFR